MKLSNASRAPRRAAALLLGGLVLLAVTAPAHAADEVNIDHVESVDGKVSMVVAVDGIPGDAAVDPASVRVEVDGRAVESSAKSIAAGDVTRTTVLVLDASNSMQQGGKFASAVAAVDAFLAAAPPDVRIGLIPFAGDLGDVIKPTLDHEAVRAALADVTLRKGTAVYDAMAEGLAQVGTDGSRSLLVLSDGGDTNSSTTLEVVTKDAQDNGVVVDVVSLANPGNAETMATLAEGTGGQVIPSEQGALQSVFSAQANALAQQLLVTFERPDDVAAEVNLGITVDADETSYTDSAFISLGVPSSAPDLVSSGHALVGTPGMLGGALALALGLAGVLAVAIAGPNRSSADRRIDAYFGKSSAGGGKRKGNTGADLRGSAVALTDKVVSKDLEGRISGRLAGAGSALTASEWLLLHAAIAVGAAVAGFVLSGAGFAVMGLVLGLVGPWLYLKIRHVRRLRTFNSQLAETLGLMAGGLQAGLSLPQAVDSVVREGNEPMAGELRRALIEQRLGVDITDALEGVGERMQSEDFSWIVMAIRIQREVGGNLAEILHTVADTLRERDYLRRQVRALSAEGRLSGYILTALPPGLFFYMMFANPDYVEVLYTTMTGWILIVVAGFLLALGGFAMAKLAKVEV
ncbi:type II secretion system F family protein [Nocardioides cavernae]|uniref:Type II secretion system F family protein n=1 Tax=Nocardioides cavernae TaxID=1921566 RepID=A0ABR8NFU3_9ACTN|nr:type II secretion system F family protein [Nocardioides cavernae]MBD3926993.1 type II secretion system F family protein [Nocardioides cavernae]MBM7512713.1 tight adherence protein B [Nocardioides cavernae]